MARKPEKQDRRFTFDTPSDFGRMIDQRVKQEGITLSEYVREAILFEMLFSGDIEAAKFVLTRVSKRVKAAMLDRLAGTDLQGKVEALASE